ncbi:MAG: cysteine hydrolase family protein [Burkholderiaceae bacterium]
MVQTFTLLSLAGKSEQPATFGNASILVIDAQNEYRSGRLMLDGVEPALQQISGLLNLARAAASPVIHIRHAGAPGGAFDLSHERGQIAEAVKPVDDELIIDKSLPNAFAGTDLHSRLSDIGRQQLIVIGFMTHMCVSSTVRAALDLGYKSTVVASATATRALPGGACSQVVSAPMLQQATLAALGDRFATVIGLPGEILA